MAVDTLRESKQDATNQAKENGHYNLTDWHTVPFSTGADRHCRNCGMMVYADDSFVGGEATKTRCPKG